MRNLTELYSRLETLSADELGAVKQRIVLLAPDAPRGQHEDPLEASVFHVICHVLKRRGVGTVYPQQLRQSKSVGKFREKLPDLAAFLDAVDPRQVVQQAALTLGVELLCDNLLEMRIPLGGTVMLANVHRLPAVVDLHFPGYAAGGMLSWIVKRAG